MLACLDSSSLSWPVSQTALSGLGSCSSSWPGGIRSQFGARIATEDRPHRQVFAELLGQIRYKDWIFKLGQDGDRSFLQVQFDALVLGKPGRTERQHGRKWMLSPHFTRAELVQTALMATLAAEAHEAREAFTYQGKRIYGPHFALDAFGELAQHGAYSPDVALSNVPVGNAYIDLRETAEALGFEDWRYTLRPHGKDEAVLTLQYTGLNTKTGRRQTYLKGMLVQPGTSPEQLVREALQLTLNAVENEARKAFTFQDQPIFGLNYTLSALSAITTGRRFDLRG